ncbi:MAG TPA: hypothetical protein DIC35_04690 [Candidatus Moranbacteria bacterium]|nr:hypothetical protein [Candidatus Moranbacteria bacterium]
MAGNETPSEAVDRRSNKLPPVFYRTVLHEKQLYFAKIANESIIKDKGIKPFFFYCKKQTTKELYHEK